MMPLRTFFMEDILEGARFSARFNLAESGSRSSSVGDLLTGAGLSPERAAGRFLATPLRDSPNWGRGDLRQKIAALHPDCGPDDVLVTTGTSEALFLLFRALRPARTALVWPAFQLLYEVPRSLGSEIVRLPVRWRADESPYFDLGEWLTILERARPDCVVLNVPHNPSGLVPDPDSLATLVDRALASGAHVIGDEHYRFLASERAALGPTVFRRSPRVFVTGSYIKCLGCPGLRIGWLIGANREVLAAAQSEKNYVTHTVNPIAEWISVEVLRDLELPIWREHRRIWLANRATLAGFLAGSRALRGAPPAGGLVTCLGLAGASDLARYGALMAAIEEADVAVLPLAAMEIHPTEGEESSIERGLGFRLGLGAEPDVFAAALDVMEEACSGRGLA